MKINYLELNNIGPYVGNHRFLLDTNSLKNIILIGGKNGAGKTSFLRGMKFGLFGCFSMGLKTETDKYYQEIRSLINNKAKDNFYIEISFDYIEDFETFNFIMRRTWLIQDGDITEKLTIKRDDQFLDIIEAKEISDKLRAMTSPQLINSFIFDGEKISSIIESGNISKYLEETFNSIFSIDLIKQTRIDLTKYLDKKSSENKSKEEVESLKLIREIELYKKQIELYEKELKKADDTLISLKGLKKANTENFYKLGGITKKQQEEFIKKIDKFNKEKEVMNNNIKNYMESDLPIYLCSNLINDAIEQMKLERQSKYSSMFKEIEDFLGEIYPEIENKLMSLTKDCSILHNIEISQYNYVCSRFKDATMKNEIIKPYLNTKVAKNDEYKLLKKAIVDNESVEKIDAIIEDNKQIDLSIIEIESDIKEINSYIADYNSKLALSYQIYSKMNDDMKKSSLYDSSFLMAKSAYDLCEKFAKEIKNKKLKEISNMALKIFNDTLRKNDFVCSLKIDNDFNLILKNDKGTILNPKTLSAGEMQILVSSLIWSMFKISGRREMFIFDTPLARLDTENRYNFITKIINTISNQVIILSTDSEFVGENLLAVNDHIYKKYLLEYNVNDNATIVTENYFGGDF